MIGYLVMVVRISCDDCWCVQIRCTSHSTVHGCHQSTVCGVCVGVACGCGVCVGARITECENIKLKLFTEVV